jgi:hypothetical protein
MSLIPVKDHKNLFRDSNTNAIINMGNNKSTENAYRVAKDRNTRIDNDIQNLKQDMVDIKTMLTQLLEK